jgi:MarR-like DNA-binding transcriptional regulator SgrR of sgrS sRNA
LISPKAICLPKAVAAALLLAAVPAWAALGPRFGGTVRIGVVALPGLEPGPAADAPSRLLVSLAHATLVELEGDGTPRPGLAEGWGSAAGGREWTLRLRPARFHDGATLRADDAVRALRRMLRSGGVAGDELARSVEGGESFRDGASDDLPGVAAPDDRRLVLRLKAGAPDPLPFLAASAAAVTSPAGSGAGPFAPVPGAAGELRFAPFVDHARGRPFLDAVVLQQSGDPSAAFAAGQVEAAPYVGAAARPTATLLLLVDPAREPFGEEGRARLDRALDRADLVRHVLPGSIPASTLLLPTLLAPLDPPPDRAVPAPVAGTVELLVDREIPPLASQRLLALVLRTGLQVKVRALPAAEVVATPAPLRLVLFTAEVPTAAAALRELARFAPRQEDLERELAMAAAEPDPDRRRSRLYAAEEMLRRTRTVLPLAFVPAGLRTVPGLHGVVADALGRPRLDDAWLSP